MAKSVRLSDYLYEEVERLARAEKRSLANMVKVLLEQALSTESARVRDMDWAKAGPDAGKVEVMDDPHFKPDPK